MAGGFRHHSEGPVQHWSSVFPTPMRSPADRIEQAFTATALFDLLTVAHQLRDEGMAKSDLLALYDSFRERYSADTDETRYNAILDTMDFIYGWCSPAEALYPTREHT